MPSSDPIAGALEAAVSEGVFPGAVLLVKQAHLVLYERAVGFETASPPTRSITPRTVYDLASLTKPLATAGAVLRLVQDGSLQLEDRLDSLLPELADRAVGRASIRQLLSHSAGLPGWRPLFERLASATGQAALPAMIRLIGEEPLEYAPGTASVYSDLGFILLGAAIERRSGRSLDTFCRERLYAPLGAAPLEFRPHGAGSAGEGSGESIAPTDYAVARGRLLQGDVHDDNAAVLGGVAGHAGLFGTARAVATVGEAWLTAYHGETGFWRPDLVRAFVTRQPTLGSSWALGWDTPSAPSSSGRHFPPEAFGHLGFTGTSIWIDPVSRLHVVLLSNRVNLGRDNVRIQQFRPRIHDLVYETFIGTSQISDRKSQIE